MAKRKKVSRASPLTRQIRSTITRREEIEYGLKELIQGILIGFILGFLIALVTGSVLVLFVTLILVGLAISGIYLYQRRDKIPGRITRIEEIEYGLMEFFFGVLIGVILGFAISILYAPLP
jgi:F0F1-type ATP synthase assembly protein I